MDVRIAYSGDRMVDRSDCSLLEGRILRGWLWTERPTLSRKWIRPVSRSHHPDPLFPLSMDHRHIYDAAVNPRGSAHVPAHHTYRSRSSCASLT